MDVSRHKILSNFNSEQEAFEYLVAYSQKNELKRYFHQELQNLPRKSILDTLYEYHSTLGLITIAASFTFVVCVFYLLSTFLNPSIEQMANHMLEKTLFVSPSALKTRGTAMDQTHPSYHSLQQHISDAMQHSDYDKAIKFLNQKEKITLLNLDEKFYFAVFLSKTKNEDLQKAIQLTNTITDEKSKFYEESLWLKALIHIKLNQYNESINLLNKLINISNYQLNNSKALLEELRKKT